MLTTTRPRKSRHGMAGGDVEKGRIVLHPADEAKVAAHGTKVAIRYPPRREQPATIGFPSKDTHPDPDQRGPGLTSRLHAVAGGRARCVDIGRSGEGAIDRMVNFRLIVMVCLFYFARLWLQDGSADMQNRPGGPDAVGSGAGVGSCSDRRHGGRRQNPDTRRKGFTVDFVGKSPETPVIDMTLTVLAYHCSRDASSI